MKLKALESRLQTLQTFEAPKIELEQYATSPHIAAHMLYAAQQTFKDICNQTVFDLGCGCGVLLVGAKLLGADFVLGADIDPEALAISKLNVDSFDLVGYDFMLCDVVSSLSQCRSHLIDTVIMNPPFGTKHNAGMDIKFLTTAMSLSSHAVYSLHKTSTRKFVLKTINDLGGKGEVLAQLCYNLPRMFKFHRKSSVDIDVDFIRISV